MLSITSGQLDALLLSVMFPLARVLGMMSTAPVFNNLAVPVRVRLMVGLAITFALSQVVPPPAPGTQIGLAAFMMQILIGVGMGLTMRIVFAAVDIAGEIIGLQMGLSFATFFDPQSAGQTSVISEFIGLLTTLIFLALNGHLLTIDILARSFELLPISAEPMASKGWLTLVRSASVMFAAGVMISLPVIAALLITNIALAVLTRAAPQLNLFAIGFPITSSMGFIVLMVVLDAFAPTMQHLFDRGFDMLGLVLRHWAS